MDVQCFEMKTWYLSPETRYKERKSVFENSTHNI